MRSSANYSLDFIAGFCSLSCGLVLLIVTFFYQLYKKDDIRKFLEILNEFDVKAKALEVKMNMGVGRTWLVRIITLNACGVFVVSLGTALIFEVEKQYGSGYSMPLGYGYVLLYLSLLILQFSFATLAIKSRFSLLHESLLFTFQNSPIKQNSEINVRANRCNDNLPAIITDLCGMLCDGIDLVNDSFTLQLIPFLVYYLTANLFAIYSVVREVYYRTPLMYVALSTNIWWILLHTSIISIALYAGYTTTKSALKTPIIVSSIVKHRKWKQSPCVVQVFKTFLLEFQYRNMFFENEFFRIDWKLLFSVRV